MDTTSAYDLWASVYDTDDNFLQALDTIQMKKLLPRLVSLVETPKPWKLIDMGCGTGRNTVELLGIPDSEVIALDASPNMLALAQKRLEEASRELSPTPAFRVGLFDLLKQQDPPEGLVDLTADVIVSTLVLEHVPLSSYFERCLGFLRPGGLLLLTNMHSEMGAISQAGFVDPASGEKVRPKSYPHTIEEILEEAGRHGLVLVGEFGEESVNEENCAALGPRAHKWKGIKVWCGGILRKVQ